MIEIIPYIILAIEDDGDREFMAWLYIQYQSLQVWNSLDSKTQYLLSAKYLLNKSGKEIANDLGMSSDNVRMALVRAKRKARQAMEDWKHSTNQAK